MITLPPPSPLSSLSRLFAPLFAPLHLQSHLVKYPLIFDINLDNRNAMKRLLYLVDGHFIDNSTRGIDVRIITFNGELRHFSRWR